MAEGQLARIAAHDIPCGCQRTIQADGDEDVVDEGVAYQDRQYHQQRYQYEQELVLGIGGPDPEGLFGILMGWHVHSEPCPAPNRPVGRKMSIRRKSMKLATSFRLGAM